MAALTIISLLIAVPLGQVASASNNSPRLAAAVPGGRTVASLSANPTKPGAIARSSSSVRVSGFGLGPGIGMGQYGAYGYASKYHENYQWIVKHYYGKTYLKPLAGAIDRSSIHVDISELDPESTTVARANRVGAVLIINGVRQRNGTHILSHNGKVETVKATAGDVRVRIPGTGWRAYQGDIQIQSDHHTWNILPLEDYIASVVPSESIPSWGQNGGEAALQAQAVAARSYAINYVNGLGAICDTTVCQVDKGDPGTYLGSYASYGDRAALSTAGEVVCSQDRSPCPTEDVVSTQYSASTGGWTAGRLFPAVVDKGDVVSPYHSWTASVALASIEAAYPQLGRVENLRVTSRNGHGTWGGRALEVKITGTSGSADDTGSDFANNLDLDSDWFRFDTQP